MRLPRTCLQPARAPGNGRRSPVRSHRLRTADSRRDSGSGACGKYPPGFARGRAARPGMGRAARSVVARCGHTGDATVRVLGHPLQRHPPPHRRSGPPVREALPRIRSRHRSRRRACLCGVLVGNAQPAVGLSSNGRGLRAPRVACLPIAQGWCAVGLYRCPWRACRRERPSSSRRR